ARVVMERPGGGWTIYAGELLEEDRDAGGGLAGRWSYYYQGSRRVALRVGEDVYFLHPDHLGSTSLTTDGSGGSAVRQWYEPYGEVRWSTGALPTDYGFTGQRHDESIRLVQMGARWYDARIGRWISADTIAPQPQAPQEFNRYSYVQNAPLVLRDPTGHVACLDDECNWALDPVNGDVVWRGRIPSVVSWLRAQMVLNARSGIAQTLADLNNTCYGCAWADVPHWVPGSTQARNSATAGDVWARASAFALFGWMVRQQGPWDPKPDILDEGFGFSQQIGEEYYYYDVWGNTMFGYLGAATDFSQADLLAGAGVEQVGSSMGYAIKYLDPAFLPKRQPGVSGPSAWDDPVDQATSRLGVLLWEKYGLDVTPRHILQEIILSPQIPTEIEPWD
ncbi:MAG: hypothetical protein GX620_04825, partial [Chloroflexi bacterium]|nr:hypothetical protein [Chloroflexota bacterium]